MGSNAEVDFTVVEGDYIRSKLIPDFEWTRFDRATEPVPLSKPVTDARVALVVTAGAYLTGSQEAFNAKTALGDDTFRVIPQSGLGIERLLTPRQVRARCDDQGHAGVRYRLGKRHGLRSPVETGPLEIGYEFGPYVIPLHHREIYLCVRTHVLCSSPCANRFTTPSDECAGRPSGTPLSSREEPHPS